jgi:uncharacterized protein YjiS (DUF1127 family)
MAPQSLPSLPSLSPILAGPHTVRAAETIGRIGQTLRIWQERARSRRALRTLLQTQRAMGGVPLWQDLGVSRVDLLSEARKPFWRA